MIEAGGRRAISGQQETVLAAKKIDTYITQCKVANIYNERVCFSKRSDSWKFCISIIAVATETRIIANAVFTNILFTTSFSLLHDVG